MTTTTATPTQRGHLDKIRDSINYFQHQLDGIRHLARMPSFLLADEMGLGKSLQALTVAAIDFQMQRASRVLIVCPLALKGNWGDELDEWTFFTWERLEGEKSKRERQLAEFDKDVLIVNYEQVIAHLATLNEMAFDIVIYDEAHYMKSKSSKRTKACLGLKASRHMLLTGSPLLGQVVDLWTLLHRIDPREWSSYWTFVNRYAVFGGYQDKQVVSVKNERELNERLQLYMLRRTKEDHLTLPPKHRVVVKLDLHPEQKRLYQQAVEEMKIDDPTGMNPMEIENALTKFLRLKQICGTTACIPGHPDHSTKLDRAVEMIEEILGNGEPIVIFTQFRDVLEALSKRLDEKKLAYRQLHGDIPSGERQPILRRWTQDAANGKPQALCCMIQVAGVGLTMTAANKCIFLDKLFVPKLNEQAEDRLHRIGAKSTVTIFHLQMRNTIESRIERILKTKNTIFGAVIDVDTSDWKKKLIAAVMEEEAEEDQP